MYLIHCEIVGGLLHPTAGSETDVSDVFPTGQDCLFVLLPAITVARRFSFAAVTYYVRCTLFPEELISKRLCISNSHL